MDEDKHMNIDESDLSTRNSIGWTKNKPLLIKINLQTPVTITPITNKETVT